MCSLHLTHPSAHTHLEQWAADTAAPGEQLGVRCLAQGSHVDNSCRSRDTNPQPRVTSPTLYSVEPRLLDICWFCNVVTMLFVYANSTPYLGQDTHGK